MTTVAGPGSPPAAAARRQQRIAGFWLGVDRFGGHAWALLGLAALIGGCGLLVAQIGELLVPAALALIIGVLVAPLVAMLERRGVNRLAATAIVFVGALVALAGLLWLVVPPFVSQATKFISGLPDALGRLSELGRNYQHRVAAQNPAAANAVEGFSRAMQERSQAAAAGLGDTLLGLVRGSFSLLLSAVLGACVAFLAIKDLPRYGAAVNRWLARPGRVRLKGAIGQMRRTGTGFVRGQLMLSMLGGFLSAIAFAIIGIPFFLPLAALAGVGRLIPGIGPIIAAIPAIALAWASGGPAKAAITGIVVLLLTEGLSMVVGPLVVGNAVEMPALAIMLILLIGGGLLGAEAVIVAVPVAAMARDAWRWYFMTEAEIEAATAESAASGPVPSG